MIIVSGLTEPARLIITLALYYSKLHRPCKPIHKPIHELQRGLSKLRCVFHCVVTLPLTWQFARSMQIAVSDHISS